MKRILSFGAGIQSTTLLLMACRGVLPRFDQVIFADTRWEDDAVYVHLEWCKKQASEAGMPVVVVSGGNLYEDAMKATWSGEKADGQPWAAIPYYVKHSSGNKSIIARQCTKYYKILPIQQFIREKIFGLKPRQRAPQEPQILQFMGISVDEAERMKPSRNRWQVSVYLFCDTAIYHPDIKSGFQEWKELPHMFSREDCKKWLEVNFPGVVVPRSACKGCPFKSDAEWRAVKANPKDWEEVVRLDQYIRKAGDGSNGKEAFLHRSCKPIDEVDFSRGEDKGQLNWLSECEGLCGV